MIKSISLIAAAALPLVAFSASTDIPSGPTPNAASPASDIVRTGTVAGWWIQSDGTVSLKLAGMHDGEEFALWFRTPASRTATTRYESQVTELIGAMLRVRGDDPVEFVVRSNRVDGGDGSGREEAMPLLGLGQP